MLQMNMQLMPRGRQGSQDAREMGCVARMVRGSRAALCTRAGNVFYGRQAVERAFCGARAAVHRGDAVLTHPYMCCAVSRDTSSYAIRIAA